MKRARSLLTIALTAVCDAAGNSSGQSTSAISERETGDCVRQGSSKLLPMDLQQHASEVHRMTLTREQILSMAEPT